MYEDRKMRINWKDVFIKLVLLALLVVLLIWLIPNPNINTFYDKVFTSNMKTMEDAARNYYTIDKLPSKVNGTSKMTLKQMLDKKLLVAFVDKDNKSCDTEKSYVEVTRLDGREFELKVNLVCDTESDYITTTVGCFGTCSVVNSGGNNQNTGDTTCDDTNTGNDTGDTNVDKETGNNTGGGNNSGGSNGGSNGGNGGTTNKKECQYKKYSEKAQYTYSCPSGYIYIGNGKCSNEITWQTPATPKYAAGSETVTPAKISSSKVVEETTKAYKTWVAERYECPSAYVYDSKTKTCTKTWYQYTYVDMTSGKPVCPSGYKYDVTYCSIMYCDTKPATLKPGYWHYYCCCGATMSGSGENAVCTTKVTKHTYYCEDSSAELVVDKCYKYTKGAFLGYSCPSGYSLNSTTCYRKTGGQMDATKNQTSAGSWAYQWSSTPISGWTNTGVCR